MVLTPGSRLGPHEVVARIGEGGMGVVYRATDTNLARQVAIKVLPSTVAGDADRMIRFEREARALAALNHVNIAGIYGLERADGQIALVMELVEGPTLADRIAAGPLAVDAVLPIATQIAAALDAAHAQGIIHRDLKPANIKVRSDGVVKLLDFGLAKVAALEVEATQTAAGLVLGTVPYMSPEQARGEPVDARSDVFSFGSVLYELLAGRPPFGGSSLLETLNAIVGNEPAPLDSALAAIVARCLAKQPAQRFQTMADVKDALHAMQAVRPEPAPAMPSIAVLPFANMSRDADDEYFSDGLAEEIINLLAQVPGLKVIARTSAFAFKGRNEDIRRIADTLGVTNVLEGSVRRAGTRIRVTAQLIVASDGTHLWSQRYDREMTDVFRMQDDIAAAIAETLKLKLAPLPDRRMPSLPAYEAYLRYRFYQWRFTPDAARRSRESLDQAIALDPAFALPYVGLADTYLAQAAVGAVPSDAAMPRARELAQRALDLDPELPEAHAMLGIVAGQYDHDWAETGRRFSRAVAREQMSPHLRSWHSFFHLFALGQNREALQQSARVIEDDPLCQMWHYCRTFVLLGSGLTDEALDACRETVELDPEFWLGRLYLGLLYAVAGRHDEALGYAEAANARAPWSAFGIGVLAGALANVGQAEKSRVVLTTLVDQMPLSAWGRALYAMCRNELDSAVEWAGKAADQRSPGLVPLFVRPYEPLLQQSAGWPALLEKLNLTPARR